LKNLPEILVAHDCIGNSQKPQVSNQLPYQLKLQLEDP